MLWLIARETGGKSYRTGIPKAIQDVTLPRVAVFARLLECRASYD
jgi:hypothetical protein